VLLGIGVFSVSTLIVANITNVADSNVFDTGAYHVVLVKWLKEYGLVKGIANLDLMYGAFSPVFILGALFESITNNENSWKILNATIYLSHLTVVISLFIKREKRRESGVLLGYILVLFFSRGYITSLSPDLWVNLAVPYSILLFSRSLDSGQSKLLVLILFTTFTVWVKLSSLPLLLLPLFSIIFNREKVFSKQLITPVSIWITVLGALYITYNLIISGYLLYPLSFTGFSFEWTVPVERVELIRNHIYLWGINPLYDLNVNYGGFWWFKDWLIRNFSPHLYRNEIIVFPFVVVGLLVNIFNVIIFNSKNEKYFHIYLTGLFFIALFFWFYGSPNLRFFSTWIWTYTGIVLFTFYEIFVHYTSDSIIKNKLLKYSLVISLTYLSGHMAIESGIKSKLIEDGMWFKTYEKNEIAYEIKKMKNGQKVHIPTDTKQPWYIALPSSREWPVYATGTVENGFRPARSQNSGTPF
jgi:hypothetical protein